jgi:hypothetical protein
MPTKAETKPAKKAKLDIPEKGEPPPFEIGCFFLDSGAFSLYSLHGYQKTGPEKYAWYSTQEYWDFVDSYARFVKKFGWAMDYYANVDVIFNPELSWKTLKYLENEHGLKPVPVIHALTDIKWIDKHLEAGYEYIGIGGTGHKTPRESYIAWANKVFSKICPASNGFKPVARTHGFAMTSFSILSMFPWWSVDSASWVKAAAFGGIYVPQKTGGEFNFLRDPYALQVSAQSPRRKEFGKHLLTLSKGERAIVEEWLAQIDVPLGTVDAEGKMVTEGVISHYKPRALANLIYFERMAESMPKWPWAWRPASVRKGFF